MTDLADQQLLTAWISAGAAIVQAVGAIAAIGVAIYLARSSEARSAAAEAASAKREEEAAKAAAERAIAADKAAAERVANALRSEQAQLAHMVTMSGQEVLADVETALGQAEKDFTASSSQIVGGFASPKMAQLMELFPQWKLRTRDPQLLRAISELERTTTPWKPGTLVAPQYVEGLRQYRDAMANAIAAVSEFAGS